MRKINSGVKSDYSRTLFILLQYLALLGYPLLRIVLYSGANDVAVMAVHGPFLLGDSCDTCVDKRQA